MGKHDYIPRPDSHFDTWQTNYVAYAAEHSRELGLTDVDIDNLTDLQTAWRKGYGNIADARAYLASTIAAKDTARAEFERLVRMLTGRIRTTADVTDADRSALGLPIPDAVPTPTLPPVTFPLLTIDTAQRLVHRLRFADSATPLKRAKPAGVWGAELRVALTAPGQPAPSDLDAYTFSRIATRTPTAVEYAGEEAGKTAHYLVRWINTKCEPGPWGPIASATVAG